MNNMTKLSTLKNLNIDYYLVDSKEKAPQNIIP